MKKMMLFILALCLGFAVIGGSAFAETAQAEAQAAEMTAEELLQAGQDAVKAEDYGKALEYYQLAADLGNAEGLRGIGNEETEIICSAIYHHDSKDTVDGPIDEILKDADVLHHTLADPTKEVKEHEKDRYEKLCAELGFTV